MQQPQDVRRSPSGPATRARRSSHRILYAVGVAFAGFVALALIRSVGDAPARQQRGDLPGVGPFLARLHLTPDPPKIGGIRVHLQVNEVPGAPVRGVTVAVMVGTGITARQRVTLEPLGGGAHEGIVTFPDAGQWWLDVEITGDSGAARLRFPVEVRGNI